MLKRHRWRLVAGLVCGMITSTAIGAPVTAFGLHHDGLGNADLDFDGTSVLVSGIGASGDDGVAITLGDAAGWRGTLDIEPVGKIDPNARLDVITTFLIDEQPAATHVSIQAEDGDEASVHVHEIECPGAVTVELRLGGLVVDTIDVQRPPFGEVARGGIGPGPMILRTERTTDNHGVIVRAFVLTLPEPTMITLAGSAGMRGDEIRLRPTGTCGTGAITGQMVSITASDIESFTLGDEAIVQFAADWRVTGGLEFTGTIDADTGPALFIGAIDPGEFDNFLSVQPVETPPTPVHAIDMAFDFEPTVDPLFYLGHQVFDRADDGTPVELAQGSLLMGACGCSYAFNVGDSDATKIVIARLAGRQVDVGSPPGFAMWYTNTLELPDAWTLELDPTPEPGTTSYLDICRWDDPAMITIFGSDPVMVDEVEVRVTSTFPANRGETASIQSAVLNPSVLGDDGAFILTHATFRTAGRPCDADLGGDGVVGADDLASLLAAWGPCVDCDADLDADGTVGPSDLAVLLAAWGPCPS